MQYICGSFSLIPLDVPQNSNYFTINIKNMNHYIQWEMGVGRLTYQAREVSKIPALSKILSQLAEFNQIF